MELIDKMDALHAVLHNQGQAAVAAVEEIKGVNIDALVNDLHSIMWYGDGCNICAHAVIEQREPYIKYGCKLGAFGNCRPMWRGFRPETTNGGGKNNG